MAAVYQYSVKLKLMPWWSSSINCTKV